MDDYVVDLEAIDRTRTAVAGGKGALLGELARIDGINVPRGFCVTTTAFAQAAATTDDGMSAAELRAALRAAPIPEALASAVERRIDAGTAYAVRSSATAEDLPTASFAGQHDSYLNVVGADEVLRHVARCWASVYTERAVAYRERNGFDARRVRMAVVVQEMAPAQAAGVLFTADPVTSNRRVASVEAVRGLGEALVSGQVNADVYAVRDGEVVSATTRADEPVLTDAQAVALVALGRRIEAHLGGPQDIEWCLVDGGFSFVQSRPITTLFPIPAIDDDERHVFVSVGHQQMMTDPMKPLGLSLWQLTAPRGMHEAAGRVFVDVAPALAAPASRAGVLANLGRSDPLIGDALQTIVDRGDVVRERPDEGARPGGAPTPIETDPAIVAELVERSEALLAALKRDIEGKSGAELLDFVLADVVRLRDKLFDPRSLAVIMAGMQAAWWLNERLEAWLGERSAADVLTRSLPDNVTSEMGLALLDVADVVRRHPEVVAQLEDARDEGFLEGLPEGEARDAIAAYLDRYGMRGVGEIDITRPRWSEQPTALVPTILAHVRSFAPGEARRRFEQGEREAQEKERDVLARLRELPDGEAKAQETKRMIDRVRTFAGYREFPKYDKVCRWFVYKRALMDEAQRLVRAGVLQDAEDVFFLRLEELRDLVRTQQVDHELIRARKEAFASYGALTPPRVMTSDGEFVVGTYRRDDVPEGALVGLPVSAGTVEGRARVVLDIAQADLEPGDILVTAYTDPSWTPLFVGIAGLVTEVGGLMTHGAVIAREYGLPAVVGVEGATKLVRDGQRIRVHGTEGHVVAV